MKAIGAYRFLPTSDPSCLVEFETEIPSPDGYDLLVKIAAVSINPVDTKVRKLLGDSSLANPRVLGFDAAGTIVSTGRDVTNFAVGDEVFYSGDLTRSGSNVEYQLVDERLVAKKPRTWTFAESAALPLVAITAWELLFERMGIDPNGKDGAKALLVINGAGGVGSALIPLALGAGLEVVATASRRESRDWCSHLGTTKLLDHRAPLPPQADVLGHTEFPYIVNLHDTESYWQATSELLAPLGTLGLIVENVNPVHIGNPLRLKSPRIVWEYMGTRSRFKTPDMHRQSEILAEIAHRCDTGTFPKLHTRIFKGLTPAHLIEAHAAMEQSKVFGKWVVEI